MKRIPLRAMLLAAAVAGFAAAQDEADSRRRAQSVREELAGVLVRVDGVLGIGLGGTGADFRFLIVVRDQAAKDEARALLKGDSYSGFKVVWSVSPVRAPPPEPKPPTPPAPPKEPEVHVCPVLDQAEIDRAIQKGIEYLHGHASGPEPHRVNEIFSADELVLLTYVHAEVPEKDSGLQRILDRMLRAKLTHTYGVSLQAMALERLDRVNYQRRIAECGQFLVDNGAPWTYAGKSTPGGIMVDPAAREPKPTGAKGDRPLGPKVLLRPRAPLAGLGAGDYSNSHFALFGLRACIDANVHPPRETLLEARKYWGAGPWNYVTSYAMEAAGMACVILGDHCLGESWKDDPAVEAAVKRMDQTFSVDPVARRLEYYYYLFALERAGTLSGRAEFGGHDWYREGARRLLDLQKRNGSWSNELVQGSFRHHEDIVADTCFAILFLKRHTRPLEDVKTPGGGHRTPPVDPRK